MEEDSFVVENEGYFSSDIKVLNTRNTEKYRRVKSLFVPSSVETIASGAFRSNKLTSIDIPDSVTKIETTAFNTNNINGIFLITYFIIISNHIHIVHSPLNCNWNICYLFACHIIFYRYIITRKRIKILDIRI